jgi:predicted amidophosphoribosyltransferase
MTLVCQCEETGSASSNLTVVVGCKQKLMKQCNKCKKQFLEFQVSHLLIQPLMEQSPSWESVRFSASQNSPHFTEPEVSLPLS